MSSNQRRPGRPTNQARYNYPPNRRPQQRASVNDPNRSRPRRKKKLRLNARGVMFLIMAAALIFFLIWGIIKIVSIVNPSEPEPAVETNENGEPVTSEVTTEPTVTRVDVDLFSSVYSNYIYLMDAEDGAEIASLSGDDRFYPASITKIMTALLVIENTDNLDATYTIPYSVYDDLFGKYHSDLSVVGIERDEVITVRDMLYGSMLRSGADCCIGSAVRVAGSEEAFVDMMNARAAELGCTNTHFTNCTGYHDTEHYTSAHDMALIMREAMTHQIFKTVISAPEYYIRPTNKHEDGITIYNNFYQTLPNQDVGGATLLGGKTGYTSNAGQSLASYASINGHEYILVTMGAFAPANVYAGRLHTTDHSLIYARLAAYINGTPTPTVTIETIATSATTADTAEITYITDESGNTIESFTVTEGTTTAATTTTESTTASETIPGQMITFDDI